MSKTPTLGEALDALSETIAERKGADADTSYTAQLLAKGAEHCARKFGEEAVETIIAAVTGDRDELAKEAGDALYHLLVALAAAGISPDDVAKVLTERAGTSGLVEKASRKG